jgi:hypothetical protein
MPDGSQFNPADELAHSDARLISNGYEPVAVDGKRALGNGWSTRPNTIEAVTAERAALPNATNTGLRTGRLAGLDIDIVDPDHADQMKELIIEILGDTPLQRRGAKGLLLCYRAETPGAKITVNCTGKPVDAAASKAKKQRAKPKLEILGVGQQFVAYGNHPDTGRPYQWRQDDVLSPSDPLNSPFDTLPVVTNEKLTTLVGKAAQLLSKLGYGDARVSGEEKPTAGEFTERAERVPVPRDQLIEILGFIPPHCDREQWIRVLGAIRATPLEGVREGDRDAALLEIADKWSSGEYDPEDPSEPVNYEGRADIAKTFATLAPKPGGTTFGTLYELARQNGYKKPPPGTPSIFAEYEDNAIIDSSAVPGSEIDMARFFATRYQSQFRHVMDWGWMKYDARRWSRDKVFAPWYAAQAIADEFAFLAEKEFVRKKIASKATVYAIVDLAKSDPRIVATPERWDADPRLLNTPGGVVDLTTGKVRDHNPADLFTKITAFAPGGDCRLWLEFLDRITDLDTELQNFLKRIAGYCLTGSIDEHALFFLYGTGGNGKGVFLNLGRLRYGSAG